MGKVRLRLLARTYPPDRPVFQFSHGGGLFDRNLGPEMVYEFTIWGDGRVVFVDPEEVFREGWMDADTVLRIVAEAMALHELEDHYVAVSMTDAATSSFTVYASRGRRTVSVYGINPEQAWPGEENHGTLEWLRGIYRIATDAFPEDAAVMGPDEVVVETSAADGAVSVGEWPSNLVGHLHGENARLAARLGGVGPAKVFKINGKIHVVRVMPVLPILSLPSNTWPEGGLPRFDSMIAYSAPGTPYRYDQTWPNDAATFYDSRMRGLGWMLVKEEKDALQVWVREQFSNDPIVIIRFEEKHMEIDFRMVHDGVPRHPDGVLGGCEGEYCERIYGSTSTEAETWFREYLGYLGWEEAERNIYERDGWRLRLALGAVAGGVEVRRERTSIEPSGWPPPPTPTPAR